MLLCSIDARHPPEVEITECRLFLNAGLQQLNDLCAMWAMKLTGGFVFLEFTQGMILPTVNGESVDPVGQPALKTETCKVSSDGAGAGRATCRGRWTAPSYATSAFLCP